LRETFFILLVNIFAQALSTSALKTKLFESKAFNSLIIH